jgi:inorganic pyrophosphatase
MRLSRSVCSSSPYQYKPFDLTRIGRSQIDAVGSPNYRVFFHDKMAGDKLISLWHDIPLDIANLLKSPSNNLVVPFVCEIPRGRTEKMEVSLKEKLNPIAQDLGKNGELRKLSIVPKFNYGMIPRTYETPDKKCEISGAHGDGDPIDVVDISVQGDTLEVGSVVPVRVLGSFCFIDGGEADWKIIVSRNQDEELNQTILEELFGFFETYKACGKSYIYGDRRLFTAEETKEVLQAAYENYNELRQADRTTKGRGEADEVEPVDIWVPGTDAI